MMDKKFLIVDDSKIARDKTSSFLMDLGYSDIYHAEDGVVAVKKFNQMDFDYVVMDLEMPNMKGDEASKEILKINPNIDIIIVTSISDKKELINILKIGVKKVLRKPVSFEMFTQVINELEAKVEK